VVVYVADPFGGTDDRFAKRSFLETYLLFVRGECDTSPNPFTRLRNVYVYHRRANVCVYVNVRRKWNGFSGFPRFRSTTFDPYLHVQRTARNCITETIFNPTRTRTPSNTRDPRTIVVTILQLPPVYSARFVIHTRARAFIIIASLLSFLGRARVVDKLFSFEFPYRSCLYIYIY